MATFRIRQKETGGGYFIDKKGEFGNWIVLDYRFTLFGARWLVSRLMTFTPHVEEVEFAEREK